MGIINRNRGVEQTETKLEQTETKILDDNFGLKFTITELTSASSVLVLG